MKPINLIYILRCELTVCTNYHCCFGNDIQKCNTFQHYCVVIVILQERHQERGGKKKLMWMEVSDVLTLLQGLTSLDSNFCNLHDWFLGRKYWYNSKDPVQISISLQFQHCTWTSWWVIGTKEYVKHESEAGEALDLIFIQIS